MEHDERAAPPPRFGFRLGHERASQPATSERFVDPHRLQLAVPTPDDAGDAAHDTTLVIAYEDPELLVVTQAGSGDGGGCDALLEHSQVGRFRGALDDEVVGAVHRLRPRDSPGRPCCG